MEVGKTRHMISSACTKRKNTQFENTPATIVQNEVSEYLSREKRSQCVAAFCRVKKSKLLSNFVLKTRKNYKFRNALHKIKFLNESFASLFQMSFIPSHTKILSIG